MKERLSLKAAVSAALIASLAGCANTGSETPEHGWAPDTTYKLTILHTNDHHGRFWHNRYGEYGMAARKTLIDELRAEAKAEGSEVLLLSGGDINTGVPESDLLQAEPDFKGMTQIGYDAMAIGNHEFDNPLSVLEKQMQWADFPMLSANIYDKETGERKFQAYQMFERNGLKVAVIGLTTEDTAKIGNPEYIGSLEFRDPKAEAKKLIAELKETEHPDIIIAATHMGHYADGKSGVNAPGDVALARYIDEGDLDLIIGGHSQEPVCMEGPNMYNKNFQPGDACTPDQQNGAWIMQAHEWGKYVGKAEFEFQNGDLNLVSYDLIPVNLKKKIKVNGEKKRVFIQDEIAKDQALYDFLKPYQDKGQEKLNVKIAKSNGKLEGDRDVVRFQQTNLGRLIAMSHMERAKADFAVMNSGGVRDSIPAGDITYKDVLKVQPFGNMVTYTDMSGKEVLDYLNVVGTKPVDSGAYVQFAGISMVVENGKVHDVKIGGEPLDMDKTYRFTVPSFNAAGGDGYPKLTNHPGNVNTGFVDAEVLKDYLEAHSPIDVNDYAPKGEIVYK
ncbi:MULTISPECIES: bifunctional UDP-sugar hydrolase/5'-nucleotidase UshA [Salinivibrio]|uniref:Bifunctional UDP-sugar hydrolase/5'-nucleotidase UshA n=1 Tax=Salinivibrio proteolyticus TaxID=334715 RepID=A0ABY7LGJ9_9GAMM|nr:MULTISPECIES: bifunctional UDP-sugar hydrolase/5'-nucleotidase UshA [Salinivibrio]OOF14584.1 bifunctional UDP-sugar hydrolase/5'-nucleotidase [Salinivibrio sp. PR919]OOF18219.1 bifunctional UDP-sugar hydrolase/5'-nucleotidase [Salinivibrio sp. PR932]OOF24816.1 bifunctional UDP-sugar hydrolase/5'-nucleotidase [Salinivibrio sp. IB872]OOF32464.1 bifunctional UDP-sugar hydrolase/5'-nucleotidase [Salinivibrio proteolyticus]WBA15506.1 bifunctional UDP-sugar hydrolase/5'-nucleotidase UshA [Saliniv